MSFDKFLAEFKAYFTELELTDFHEKRLSEMWHKHKHIEVVEKRKVEMSKEVIIRPIREVIYVDPTTMKQIPKVKDPEKIFEIFNKVLNEVCGIWNVRIADVVSPKRARDLVYARFFCYLKLRELGFTYSEIGRRFRRDHTSVMAGIDNANNLLDTNCEPFAYLWSKYNQQKKTA